MTFELVMYAISWFLFGVASFLYYIKMELNWWSQYSSNDKFDITVGDIFILVLCILMGPLIWASISVVFICIIECPNIIEKTWDYLINKKLFSINLKAKQ